MGTGTGISGIGANAGYTYISLDNPATIAGVVDSIKYNVYTDAGASPDTIYFVSAYLVSGITYAIRDTCVVYDATDHANGALVTYVAGTDFNDLSFHAGDYIGFTTVSAGYIRIRMVNTGHAGVMSKNTIVLTGSATFGANANYGASIAAYYTIPAATVETTQKNGYSKYIVPGYKGY